MARRLSNSRAARRAFTIIELTIVILIMAILAAAAAPRYRSALAHYRIDAAAGRIAGDLRMIRQYARKTSELQTVAFDVASDSYAAPDMPDMNFPNVTYAVDFKTSDYLTDIVSADFGGDETVDFDIYGRPDTAGEVVVQADGLQRTVQVDEAGHVSIP